MFETNRHANVTVAKPDGLLLFWRQRDMAGGDGPTDQGLGPSEGGRTADQPESIEETFGIVADLEGKHRAKPA